VGTLTASLRRALGRARRAVRGPAWDARLHPKLAFTGPLPPAPTGIATYTRAVLDALGERGFFERHDVDLLWPIEPRHDALIPWYRLGVYQLGNNVEFHRDIYRLAWHAPGLVVLHDLALDDFVRGLLAAGDPLGFAAEREASIVRDRLRSTDALASEPLRTPWCADIVRRARGIVVHADFSRRYLEEFGCRTPVYVVPHPVVESEDALERARRRAPELRSAAGCAPGDALVVAAGDLNEAKCLDAVVAAVAKLPDGVRLALVGRRIEGFDVDALLRGEAGARTTLSADVSNEDFLGWLWAADVVVDLRFPHRGESSGTLARAMQAGRAAVVSATGTYLDLPDDVVARVAAGPPDVAELATAIRRLVDDADGRRALGERARAHVYATAGGDATGRAYEEAIDSTLALVDDPVRSAVARWGAALVDLGVSEEMLRSGYGVDYARRLEDFTRSS
jgi:glycosyltransferase involved in cell wall biosynthesis